MSTLAILPVKGFDQAKTRLRERVPDGPRAGLAEAMVRDVLRALGRVAGLDGVIVVTAEPIAAELAELAGAEVVHDPAEAGQSAAVALGIARALERGADRVLAVPGDCPALDPGELAALLRAPEAIIVVPDRHGSGTNALLLAPPTAIAPSFGPGSRERHETAARESGLPWAVREVPGLAMDADTPEDLATLEASGRLGATTTETLEQLGLSDIRAFALSGLPEVRPGDDLAALLIAAAPADLGDGDVLCIAHKVVSKAEGRVVDLADVVPGARARELAESHGKDARQIEVVLEEAATIVRERPGVLICRTRHGFVCANAGVDASNAGGDERLILLPLDPDTSARAIRAALRDRLGVSPAVVVTDSFGRAWRRGQCEVAIGVAGLLTVESWDGLVDSDGRELRATAIAVADEAAAAADLVRSKDSREPAVVVRGLDRHVRQDDGPGARDLVRSAEEDLFL